MYFKTLLTHSATAAAKILNVLENAQKKHFTHTKENLDIGKFFVIEVTINSLEFLNNSTSAKQENPTFFLSRNTSQLLALRPIAI